MSDTTEEVHSRLSTTIEAWDLQITESHDALSQQLHRVRTHLTRLLEPSHAPSDTPGMTETGSDVTIASLESEVAQLTEALKRARNAAPPLVGGPPLESNDADNEAITLLEAELASATATVGTLQAALDTRNAELGSLREELASATAKIEAGLEHVDTLAKLQATVDAQDTELESLREELAAATAKNEAGPEHVDALTKLQQSTDSLQAALIAAETRNRDLEQTIATHATTTEIDTAKANEEWSTRLEAATQETTIARARCAELEEALETAKMAAITADATQVTLDTLQQDHEKTLAQIVELEGRLTDAEAQAVTQDTTDAATEPDGLQQDYDTALARIGELESQLAQQQVLQTTSSQEIDGSISIKAFDSQGHKKRMGEILMELGVLDDEQLKKVLKEQSAEPQQRLGALVVSHGFTGEDIVAKILAAQLRLPYCDVRDMEITQDAADLVSPHVAQLHRCMPLSEENGALTVAMVNPLDLIAIEDLELASRCRVVPMVSTPSQIDARLLEFYGESI